MLTPPSTLATRRSGTIAVLTAVGLTGVMAASALAIDASSLFDTRRQVQTAADAAALAAATDLFNYYYTNSGLDSPGGTGVKSAKTTATALGYTDGVGGTTVKVNIPPKSGTFTGQSGYAEVIITYQQLRYLSGMWGSGTMSVQARSVARGLYVPGTIGVLVLDPHKNAACEIDGNLTILNNGSVTVNSDGTTPNDWGLTGACYIGPHATFVGGSLNVVGSTNNTGGSITGTQTILKTAAIDPLINVPEPTAGTNLGDLVVPRNTTRTINPGTYNSITIKKNAVVTMAAGVYVFTSSGSGNSPGMFVKSGATISGDGVMIYNNVGDNFDFTAAGVVNLTPPTSGVYAGISWFQPRSDATEIHIESANNVTMAGTIYAAAGEMDFRPDGSAIFNMGNYICDQMEAGQGYDTNSGTSTGRIYLTPSKAAATKRSIVIVE